jgi:hypothetical protein
MSPSLFQFLTYFASKTILRLIFNQKLTKTNYSTLNACGLAIFFKFLPFWFFSNLSFFERDHHMDSPEEIQVKAEAHSDGSCHSWVTSLEWIGKKLFTASLGPC